MQYAVQQHAQNLQVKMQGGKATKAIKADNLELVNAQGGTMHGQLAYPVSHIKTREPDFSKRVHDSSLSFEGSTRPLMQTASRPTRKLVSLPLYLWQFGNGMS